MMTGPFSSQPGNSAGEGGASLAPAFLGVMQGRLLPPRAGRIQAFPGTEWPVEFERAAEIGLTSIEWILESPLENNPLWSAAGCMEIRRVMASTGVSIHYICADIFMESPWVRMSADSLNTNREILLRLISCSSEIGAKGIEIPCVDPSEIRNSEEEDELVRGLEPCLKVAESAKIQLGLETSLPPTRFKSLLDRFGSPVVRANYDSGNSASLGYDPSEEIQTYGEYIANVHIKDRTLGGGTVPLGSGAADIPRVLLELGKIGYPGGFILQAARHGDEVAAIKGYLQQLRDWLYQVRVP